MKKFGIDLSHWQGFFNFKQALTNEKIEFAILKIGGSDKKNPYKDVQFENYYAQCKAYNIPVGCYFFGGDLTVESAVKSADYFISLMNGNQFELPVYYDVEAKMTNLSKSDLVKIVKTFCERVEKAGFYVGIYANQSAFNTKLNDSSIDCYTKWVARYAKEEPVLSNNRKFDMWQYGGGTNLIRSDKINGITVDQDFLYKDFTSTIKKCGLNGFTKVVQTVPSYYNKYTGSSVSIVTALKAVGETDTTLKHRKEIAKVNGFTDYNGSASDNTKMLALLKQGKLLKG